MMAFLQGLPPEIISQVESFLGRIENQTFGTISVTIEGETYTLDMPLNYFSLWDMIKKIKEDYKKRLLEGLKGVFARSREGKEAKTLAGSIAYFKSLLKIIVLKINLAKTKLLKLMQSLNEANNRGDAAIITILQKEIESIKQTLQTLRGIKEKIDFVIESEKAHVRQGIEDMVRQQRMQLAFDNSRGR